MNTIIEKEIALHQHEVRTDRTRVETLLHRDFIEVGESGNSYSLKSILDLLGDEQPDGNRIHSQDYQSIELASGVYLLLYKSVMVSKEGDCSHYAKRSSIWSLTDHGWQMKYHQGTPCEKFAINA